MYGVRDERWCFKKLRRKSGQDGESGSGTCGMCGRGSGSIRGGGRKERQKRQKLRV